MRTRTNELAKVDRLVPKPMTRDNALGTTRSTCVPMLLGSLYV
jgi:hypothetical protein